MSQRRTLFERISANNPRLTALAEVWTEAAVSQLLHCVWNGCDALVNGHLKALGGVSSNDKSLERSLNALLDPLIHDSMPVLSPFYFQHEPPETQTMRSDKAQPPTPDFGFRLREDPGRMWPIEAKVLSKDEDLSKYLGEIKSNFLTCRYGPLANGGAMLGYLLEGQASTVFANIEE